MQHPCTYPLIASIGSLNLFSFLIIIGKSSFRSESCSLFCFVELLEKAVFAVALQNFNARLSAQAYLALFDNGGGNLPCCNILLGYSN